MRLFRWLSRRRFPYEPLISIAISRSRLLANLAQFQKLAPGSVMIAPVLKSNAYGHGLIEAARILHESVGGSIPFTVVDSYFEAVALRAQGCKHPLLVIGYSRPETIAESYLPRTAFTISSIATLRTLHGDKPPAPEGDENGHPGPGHIPRSHRVAIHLKIDTGMRRQGILPSEVAEAIEIVKGNESLVLEGLCTHFADADNADESFTEGQINLWNKLVHEFKVAFPAIKYFHAANTDGSAYSRDIEGNVIRLGIGLYGLSDNPRFEAKLALQPALELRTVISGVKTLAAGETVGYGNTFQADRDMTIATVPVGYYEGLDRRLSGKGSVLVGPDRIVCPIVGRVSMNITTIDVTSVPGVAEGMNAIVISREASDPNSLQGIARTCGTIAYEIAAKIPAHLKRVIVD